MSELFEFAQEEEPSTNLPKKAWKILVIDDEESIHDITANALKSVVIDGRRLELINAMSAADAKIKLSEHDDIALALVDVIMETPTAGLDLVNYIRNDLNNHLIRLVIRTGQPDEVPERDIINQYDITDYKEKTELSVDKFYTVVRSSIRQYTHLKELETKYEDVYKQMTVHPLTKLPNRQKLNEHLDQVGTKNLVLINIDGFSAVNETQGFNIGDELLMQMGGFLYSMYGDEMNVFHLEGDTFALLCIDDLIDEQKLLNIQQDINQMSFLLGGIENRLSVTLGLAMHEEGNLIQKAEFALKEARTLGRNRVSKYSDDIKIIKTIQNNSKWTQRIREAIERNNIIAYYQPIFSIETGKVIKYECLVRMVYKEDIISPYKFLEAARNSGQLHNIFKIMFENACKKTREFSGQFTVNLTDQDLQEPGLLEFIDRTLRKYNVDPKQIGIEILEEKSIVNNVLIKERLEVLYEKGMSIIIDDFGAECSNFGQLISLPISVIKIDGMFIKDIVDNEKHRIIAEAIIGFATRLEIPTVAEFVHNKEVLDMVTSLGVTYSQGFYLGEPRPTLLK
ncbi:EAL domain-containing protein [Sulfurimonas sp. MAG313]|nr:GGDEF and EAL domain-containing protein [Sulfurimonas sp. MAG313]MDF1881201.1 EAL domain-containing protein [Sulfurimonas sp. MAG313]